MRKSMQNSSKSDLSVQSTESQITRTGKGIDTTRTESGKIIITEIEFYPPDTRPEQNKLIASNVGGIDLLNVGEIQNASIKSIKQTTIESAVEQKGESKESSKTEGKQSEAILANNEQHTEQVVAPTPDPYRWRYIFYIVVVISIGILYCKRIPILNWIKKILSGIKRIL
jgi:hypothetical protein